MCRRTDSKIPWTVPRDLDLLGTLSKRGRQQQHWEARKIFLSNPHILLSISLLWLPCMFLFWLKLLTPASPSEWNSDVGSNEMSATFWRQCGNGAVEVSFESRMAQMSSFPMHLLSSVISLIVLPMLPLPSWAVLLELPIMKGISRGLKHTGETEGW